MLKQSLKYLHLIPDAALPALEGLRLFKAVLVIDDEVSEMGRCEVSRWLVASGCRYLLAWGNQCGTWAESVDEASQEAANYEDVPEEEVVMTTAHEDDDLDEVFWFAKHRAKHPAHDLRETLIVHIAEQARRDEIEAQYHDA